MSLQTSSTCPACGASMADDQRYCMACGERRGPARVAFPLPAAPAAEPPPAPPAAGRAAAAQWVTAVSMLLLALGVGVLIGRSGDEPVAAARPSAPVTVTVPAAAAAPAATATTTATAVRAKAKTSKASKATKKQAAKLDTASPDENFKRSKALPKTVGTGGKAPPKDKKPAGGGSDFEDIG